MIRRPTPTDTDALTELFGAIDTTHFHPHAMDRAGAEAIAGYVGQDEYLVAWVEERAVAYGMLRGWDEGYAVPSLGIAVRRDAEGRGHGRAMMMELARAAAARGATMIRLRVHPDNARARRLYELSGYVDAGEERGERLLVLTLSS